MHKSRIILLSLLALFLAGCGAKKDNPPRYIGPPVQESPVKPEAPKEPAAPVVSFVGPRQNTASDTPTDYGFWSFAIPVPGVLSRSGQPTAAEFKWMKVQGWKGVVDLRVADDHEEVSDDRDIPGFKELGFNYLWIQIVDGGTPTEQQADDYLKFATDPANQPFHVHCRGGYGRTGVMTALYRYSVERWPMDQAIAESRLFKGGVSDSQTKWLLKWAESHPAGSYAK